VTVIGNAYHWKHFACLFFREAVASNFWMWMLLRCVSFQRWKLISFFSWFESSWLMPLKQIVKNFASPDVKTLSLVWAKTTMKQKLKVFWDWPRFSTRPVIPIRFSFRCSYSTLNTSRIVTWQAHWVCFSLRPHAQFFEELSLGLTWSC